MRSEHLDVTGGDVLRHTQRARYSAGQIDGREVPAYVDEDGVDPGYHTETFAEVDLELDNWRWQGTTFRLRAAKALGRDRKELAVRFRQVPRLPYGVGAPTEVEPNVLRFGLDPESMRLEVAGIGTDPGTLAPLAMTAQLPPPGLPAYGQLLLNVLNQDARLSIRGDEAERRRILKLVNCGMGQHPVEDPGRPPSAMMSISQKSRLRGRPHRSSDSDMDMPRSVRSTYRPVMPARHPTIPACSAEIASRNNHESAMFSTRSRGGPLGKNSPKNACRRNKTIDSATSLSQTPEAKY